MNKMKFRYFLFALGILLYSSCQESKQNDVPPRLGGWDYDWMMQAKDALQEGDNYFIPAYEQLISDADKALNEGPFSVTYKNLVPPSGSKHDYMSLGPYWWPDPSKPNGFVTTPTTRIPISRAICATTGAAPVPVPPPIPAVIKTISAPEIASAMRSRSSIAA